MKLLSLLQLSIVTSLGIRRRSLMGRKPSSQYVDECHKRTHVFGANNDKDESGLTLIELLVIMAIMAILAVGAAFSVEEIVNSQDGSALPQGKSIIREMTIMALTNGTGAKLSILPANQGRSSAWILEDLGNQVIHTYQMPANAALELNDYNVSCVALNSHGFIESGVCSQSQASVPANTSIPYLQWTITSGQQHETFG